MQLFEIELIRIFRYESYAICTAMPRHFDQDITLIPQREEKCWIEFDLVAHHHSTDSGSGDAGTIPTAFKAFLSRNLSEF